MKVKSLAWGWRTRGRGYSHDWDESNPERIEVAKAVSVVEPNPITGESGKLVVVCRYKNGESLIPYKDAGDGFMVIELEVKDDTVPEGCYSLRLSGCTLSDRRSTPTSRLNEWRDTVAFQEKSEPRRWSISSLLVRHRSSWWFDRVLADAPKEFDLGKMDSGQFGDFREYQMERLRWEESNQEQPQMVNQLGTSLTLRRVDGTLRVVLSHGRDSAELCLSNEGLTKLQRFIAPSKVSPE